ncbi:MAG TPA: ABC transporter ATP-binding protein [Candidatus Dormibacteraeota bacterium]|nr:ABC transporter ATP-binding protein [Candidatus Dormibacteraeota bacterium]
MTKRYPKGTLAVDNVTWSIATGARACLLGPNGAGKTTCIRLLEGALEPTSGTVELLGSRVADEGYLDARRRTGIVPQGPGMYTDITVSEYLALAARLYARGNVDRVVEVFDLGDHRQKVLSRLSGGYQRRVVLAAALLSEPEVLLLDEPTVGLDPIAAHDVHEFLREAMHDRTTLLCTHNLAEAEALCDDVVILRDGKVLVHSSLADLRQRSKPRLMLAARQGAERLLQAMQDLVPDARAMPEDGTVAVTVDDPEVEAPGLLRRLLAQGLDVYRCQPVRPTLEDLFIQLVNEET